MKLTLQAIYLFTLLGCNSQQSIGGQQNTRILQAAADPVPECIPRDTVTLYLMNVETNNIQEIILDPPAFVGRTIAFALHHIRIKNGQLRFEYDALREDFEVYKKRMEVKIRA